MPKGSPMPAVLGADDDEVIRKLLAFNLEKAGIPSRFFESGAELVEAVDENTRVCITDLKMPGMDGLACLKAIKAKSPFTEVIFLSNVDEAKQAILALREGAYDYLGKPFDPEEIIHLIRKARDFSRTRVENQSLKATASTHPPFGDFIHRSTAMEQVQDLVDRISGTDSNVLLTGESGTGKTHIARLIHQKSRRAKEAFISVSCPSLPRELLESEMFGHERGAFSGAVERRLGRAELANQGTLFLDEIGEMPLELQPKLLTFLQDKRFFRVGGQKEIEVDVRVIAATNRDLRKEVEQGKFREDLYFRLNILPIEIPPLRDRREEIPMIAEHFLRRHTQAARRDTPSFDPDARERLMQYDWPGNVRELENIIERAYILSGDRDSISPDVLPAELKQSPSPSTSAATNSPSLAGRSLADLEKQAIRETLALCNGKKSEAARLLGITEKSVYNKIHRYGL